MEHLLGDDNFIIQEYINLDSKEYTAGVYTSDDQKIQHVAFLKARE